MEIPNQLPEPSLPYFENFLLYQRDWNSVIGALTDPYSVIELDDFENPFRTRTRIFDGGNEGYDLYLTLKNLPHGNPWHPETDPYKLMSFEMEYSDEETGLIYVSRTVFTCTRGFSDDPPKVTDVVEDRRIRMKVADGEIVLSSQTNLFGDLEYSIIRKDDFGSMKASVVSLFEQNDIPEHIMAELRNEIGSLPLANIKDWGKRRYLWLTAYGDIDYQLFHLMRKSPFLNSRQSFRRIKQYFGREIPVNSNIWCPETCAIL